jgi:hypothetical protein
MPCASPEILLVPGKVQIMSSTATFSTTLESPNLSEANARSTPLHHRLSRNEPSVFVVSARSKPSYPARGLPPLPPGRGASEACCGHDPQ